MSYFTDFGKIDKTKYFFDAKAASDAVRYIETHCFHVKGALAGTRFILSDWQKERIIEPLFGWKHIEPTIIRNGNGDEIKRIHKRKYRKAYIEVPKKNGKSTLLSGIAQIFLDIDPEQGSEIVGVAWGRKQASIIFDMVEKSVKKSPRMKDKIDYYRSTKVLRSKDGEKRYSVWSKEAGGEDGQFPQLVIIDELHEHKNGDVVSVAEKSMMGRTNPLSITITTAGKDLYGIGYQRSQECKDIAKGLFEDESQLVCIYCADEDDDIWSEKTWIKANPQLGKSISLDDFKEEVKEAKKGAGKENSFKRYFLNIWNNDQDAWVKDSDWIKCNWEIDEKLLLDNPCKAAIDLSSRSDITALTLMWQVDGKYYSKNWFWLPEDKGTRSADDKNERYLDWVARGHIVETAGNIVDYDFIFAKLDELKSKYNIISMAYDDWNSHHLMPKLVEAGFDVYEFRQGFKSMNAPTKEYEAMVLSNRVNHFGNPVLRWMVGNAAIQSDPAGNVKIIKDHKRPEKKVDGVISNIMAFAMWLNPPETEQGTYLTDNELFVI